MLQRKLRRGRHSLLQFLRYGLLLVKIVSIFAKYYMQE